MAEPVATKEVAGERRSAGWGLPVALVLLGLLLVLCIARRQPPEPKPAGAPAAEFSAGRAGAVLRGLLRDGRPHPVGSPAHGEVRDRILAHLRSLGYAPEVQEGFACHERAQQCAQVQNVIARLQGTQPSGAVLLMAHYDSVGAGPGAADDMAGVAAVLEVARVLAVGPAPKNTVILLLEDGEEAQLLGADFFAASPAAGEVKAVVNLEARGSSGPSMMFETSGPNGWMIPLFAAGAPHPVTSSVFATIYELLPNDTDLTVFKRRGVPGLNFAFVEDPTRYHTAADTVENLSLASLQHHGDNALAAVRGLAGAELANPPRGNVVFFDVLGARVVRWPAGWTLWIALLALLLVLAVAVLGFRGRLLTGGGLAYGFLAFLGAAVLSAVVAWALTTLVRGAAPVPWVAKPVPLLATFWLLPLALTGFLVGGMARRAGLLGLWAGIWLGWVLLGLVLAFTAPGVSYLFLVPALIAGLAGLAGLRQRSSPASGAVAVLLPLLVAAILWFPIVVPLYVGLGTGGLVPISALLALLYTALAPLFSAGGRFWQRLVPILASVMALIFFVGILVQPPYSPASPQPVNLELYQNTDTGEARWIVRCSPPFPAELRKAANFAQRPATPYPWSPPRPARAWIATAPPLAVPAPELTVVSDVKEGTSRRLRLRLSSPRGAHIATVLIPASAGLQSIALEGHRAAPERPEPSWPEWYAATHLTLPPGGADVEVVLSNTAPLDWYVLDRSSGLPPSGEALRKARPDAATAFQDGDATVVSRKVRI